MEFWLKTTTRKRPDLRKTISQKSRKGRWGWISWGTYLKNEFNKLVNGDDVLVADLMTGLRTEKYIKEFKKNKKTFELIE